MLPPKYSSTENKERVRQEDTELIRKECIRKNRKLSYLGMPSGEMIDILTWKEYFERSTAVEIDTDQRNTLILNIMRNNMQNKVKVLFGDIEEVLINGKDNYNNKLEYPYDVIFLDCFGALLYKGLRRTKAISCMIEKQKGHSFLLFITFNLRERKYCKKSILTVLSKIQNELYGFYIHDSKLKNIIHGVLEWYKSQKTHDMYRQKLFVPYYIKTTAEQYGFKAHAYSPIYYLGFNKSPMIHFLFKMLPEYESPTKAVSEQTIIDILNMNIKEAHNKIVFVRKEQAPLLNIKM